METKEIVFTDKEQVFYNRYIGNYATPKKLNRSAEKIPASIIEAIEAGEVTSAVIKDLSAKVPVFTYKTCLTIHGNFPEMVRQRIGGYKNLIQNANGSLEVRYSALDAEAKKQISYLLKIGEGWNTRENSFSGRYFEKVKITNDKPEALAILAAFTKEAETFNCEGMKARVSASGYNVWGRYYLILTVSPLLIDGEPERIAASMLGMEYETVKAEGARMEAERQQRSAAREAYISASMQKTNELREKIESAVQRWPLRAITPKPDGTIYVKGVATMGGGIKYKFFRVKGAAGFGRVKLEVMVSAEPTPSAAWQDYPKQVKPTEITGTRFYQ